MTGPQDAAVSMPGGSAVASDVPFEAFVAAFVTAVHARLAGAVDRAEAEDLLQGVLERAYRRWGRICRDSDPERYVRPDARERVGRPLAAAPAQARIAGHGTGRGSGRRRQSAVVADRDQLLRALAALAGPAS
jgi:DNA-directed RNA polymerase specialized sigma24 family protein